MYFLSCRLVFYAAHAAPKTIMQIIQTPMLSFLSLSHVFTSAAPELTASIRILDGSQTRISSAQLQIFRQTEVALVTGGDSGIGRAVCYHFSLEGAIAAFVYLSPAEEVDAKETLEKLLQYKAPHSQKPMKIPVSDLGYHDQCNKVVEEVVKAYGRIDILVNNVAEQKPCPNIEDMDPNQVERVFRTNVFSQFFTVIHGVKHMEEGSSIINCLSRQAYLGHAENVDYASTKGAIVTFTRGLALQLAKRKIRVNGVAPGPIWTPINASLDPDKIGKDGPLGRIGQPCEVAPCFVFLASQDASCMTGQILHPNATYFLTTFLHIYTE